MSRQTARKWLRRFQEGGQDALRDRSSRPARTRNTVTKEIGERIEQLPRARMPMRRIAVVVGAEFLPNLLGHQAKQLPRAGVKQNGLVVKHQALVEAESARKIAGASPDLVDRSLRGVHF